MASKQRKTVYGIAILVSVLLFLAGLFIGLNTERIIQQTVKKDIGSLQSSVDEEFGDLRSYLDEASLDLKNIQLQQLFVENFDDNPCDFRERYLDLLYSQYSQYWELLPARLEEYERNNIVSDEYNALKREYVRLSLRFWINAETTHRICSDVTYVPVLYFYTSTCDKCVQQGLELDSLRELVRAQNQTLLVFPIDARFDDDTVFLLREHYNLTEYPALIVNDVVYQGSVVSAQTLFDLV